MTTYTWPTPAATGSAFNHAAASVGFIQNQVMSPSMFNGNVQVVTLPGARLRAQITFPEHSYAQRAALEAFLNRVSGMEHRIALFDMSRSVPRGTIALSSVTMSAASQFATTVTLNNCGANATLLAGDWFRVVLSTGLFQMLQATQDFTANGSGVMTLTDGIRPGLRSSVAGGAAVVTDHPTALYVIMEGDGLMIPRGAGGKCPEFTTELMEMFS